MTNLWVDPHTFDTTCVVYRSRRPHLVQLAEYRESARLARTARMGQVRITETTFIRCRFCGSDDVVKNGVRNAVQYYWCKACERKFSGNNALPGMRVAPDRIATAVSLFYEGLSVHEIARSVAQIFNDPPPSGSTIYDWVSRFTRAAISGAKGLEAQTGPTWAADETVLGVAGGHTKRNSENTIWFWDVIDLKTRFLLASHLSRTRTSADARALFTRAANATKYPPREIITDRLRSYIDGIERVFGADTVHIQSAGMRTETHNNYIERFHGTLKQRTKVMRGMRNPETARLLLDGWLIHYNYFRPHEGLQGKTPGQLALVQYPFRNWHDVVMSEAPENRR